MPAGEKQTRLPGSEGWCLYFYTLTIFIYLPCLLVCLSRDRHSFCERTKFFVKDGVVQKKLKTNEQPGSFKEKKTILFKKRMN